MISIITTSMTFAGMEYQAVCDCSKEMSQLIRDHSSLQCTPSRLKIRTDREAAPLESGETSQDTLTQAEAKQIIGDVPYLELVDVKDQSFRCLDGRVREDALFTPGGDAGEFISGLLVYENMKGQALTQAQIVNLLTLFLGQYFQSLLGDNAS
jgi:hypothetical protein